MSKSFSSIVKNEVSKIVKTKVENIAELSAIIKNSGSFDNKKIEIITENPAIARHIFNLFKNTYEISPGITVQKNNIFNKNNIFILTVKHKVKFILEDLGLKEELPPLYLMSDDEEKRAYLRGLFLVNGSVNDPKTARYHLEFTVTKKKYANYINQLLNEYELNSKVLKRDKSYMIYIKEAEKISDFLKHIEANGAVLYYEDIRIYRDHKNMINRLNNCEQANVEKSMKSSDEYTKYYDIIKDNDCLELLDEKVKLVLEYRIKYHDISLQELSEIITVETNKPITKSGVNHRLRKAKELALKIKNKF